ncbi:MULTISPECIES: hypothetical protein [unclassified Mesorhizobium]|uniref:hypothetical protein n=1 Tax=unclassified Mesorhizobium TaxID=325217 RepID=UPI001FEFC85F|nr:MULTISPECIES: hypothetical protein [unclassified Mesorhizobium]
MASRGIRLPAILFLLTGTVALWSCVVPDDTSKLAKEDPTTAAAQKEMVGLSEADLRMCAGFPTATADEGASGQIWSYERAVQRGNVNVVLPTFAVGPIPSVGGSVNVAPGGYCNTQVRIVAAMGCVSAPSTHASSMRANKTRAGLAVKGVRHRCG